MADGDLRVSIVSVNSPGTTASNRLPGSEYDGLTIVMERPGLAHPNEERANVTAPANAQGQLIPDRESGWRRSFHDSGFLRGEFRLSALSSDEARRIMADGETQLKAFLSSAARFVQRSRAGVPVTGQNEVDVPGRSDVLAPLGHDRFELRREEDGTVKVYARATQDNPPETVNGARVEIVSAECKLTEDASGATTCEAGANFYINQQHCASPEHPVVGLWDVHDPDLLREIATVVTAGSKD